MTTKGGSKHGEENDILLLALLLMGGVLVLASGVALDKSIPGTDTAEKIVGTKFADHINSLGGDNVV